MVTRVRRGPGNEQREARVDPLEDEALVNAARVVGSAQGSDSQVDGGFEIVKNQMAQPE
jgi:hypothetical protein